MDERSYTDNSSTVCLDAVELKRIREELQLTQLYVSKVVGVTTDTISRWENNRYPTIRRENALKLAEALEVPLTALLLKPEEELVPAQNTTEKKFSGLWVSVSLLIFVTLILLVTFLGSSKPLPATVSAERILPEFSGPGSVIPVQVALNHSDKNNGIILREYFPKGWKIIQANPPASSLDNVNGVARWIIKVGDERDRVVYLIQVDPLAKLQSEGSFRGEVVASRQGSQSAVPVQGESKITVARAHWADADGDGHIDDGEMLEASFTIEDMAGVHIDWNDLERLWAAGSYAWDPKKRAFLPSTAQ